MSHALSESTTEALQQVDLPALCDHLGVPTVRSGARYYAKCWAGGHADSHPSVQLHNSDTSRLGKAFFFCHSCRNRGDSLDLIQQVAHVDREESERQLLQFCQTTPLPAPRVHRPAAPTADACSNKLQSSMVASFIETMCVITGHGGGDQAHAYLRDRGVGAEVIERSGPFFVADRPHLQEGLRRLVAEHGPKPLIAAGIVKHDPERQRLKLAWWDSTIFGVSRRRDGLPMFVWGRRLRPQDSDIESVKRIRYVNQCVAGGSHLVPFGLRAIREAIDRQVPLRFVEGPITALASESLPDGLAAPSVAMLSRVGWGGKAGVPDQYHRLFSTLVPELQQIPSVHLVYDQDQDERKLADGKQLAENAASWLRNQGCKAEALTLSDYGLPDKDFADASKRLTTLT